MTNAECGVRSAERGTMLYLLRYGELTLKSNYVRKSFEKTVIENIKRAFIKNEIECIINRDRGHIYIETSDDQRVPNVLKNVTGIVSFSPVKKFFSSSFDCILRDVHDYICKYIEEKVNGRKVNGRKVNGINPLTFALRVKRAGTHPYRSTDVAEKLGKKILETINNFLKVPLKVDLRKPEIEIFIEIRDNNIYVYTEKIEAIGGLPAGVEGKVLGIIQNKYDILALVMMIRRGCRSFFVATSEQILRYAEKILKKYDYKAEGTILNKNDFNIEHIEKLLIEKNCRAIVFGTSIPNEIPTLQEKYSLPYPQFYPLIGLSEQQIEAWKNKVFFT